MDSIMRVWGMHERTLIELSSAARAELEAVVANRNSPQKHVWRAKIVLLTADGYGSAEIMRRTGKAKTVIWRWQERFAAQGVAALWRDKTRPPRIAPLKAEIAARVVSLTLAGPPANATHWTGAAMAEAVGISVSSVQRIWRAHGLQPHRAGSTRSRVCSRSCLSGASSAASSVPSRNSRMRSTASSRIPMPTQSPLLPRSG